MVYCPKVGIVQVLFSGPQKQRLIQKSRLKLFIKQKRAACGSRVLAVIWRTRGEQVEWSEDWKETWTHGGDKQLRSKLSKTLISLLVLPNRTALSGREGWVDHRLMSGIGCRWVSSASQEKSSHTSYFHKHSWNRKQQHQTITGMA